jgi:hypothetical protein
LFDLVELVPSQAASGPATAAQHLTLITLEGPIHLEQRADISGDAVVGIVAAQDGIEFASLLLDRIMSYLPHQRLQRHKAALQARFRAGSENLDRTISGFSA